MKIAIILLLLSHISFGQEDSSKIDDAPFNFPIIISYQNNSAQISHVNQFRLEILAEYLQENPQLKIVIEGHVCCGPDLPVSRRRAKSVYKNLKRQGVPKGQMKFIGKSFDEPRVLKEKSEDDKDMNRRVEIELIKP